jgi:hypothetical protein
MNNSDPVENAAIWLEALGYTGDLSALTAGVHDIVDSIQKIQNEMLPNLLKLSASQRDQALDIIVDLIVEMEHISRHANDAMVCLTSVRDYIDQSQMP